MTLRRSPLGYDALRVYARVLRDHVPELHIDKRTTPLGCAVCAVSSFVRWPCPDWKRASESLDD